MLTSGEENVPTTLPIFRRVWWWNYDVMICRISGETFVYVRSDLHWHPASLTGSCHPQSWEQLGPNLWAAFGAHSFLLKLIYYPLKVSSIPCSISRSPIREDLCFIHLTLSELLILGPLMHTSTLNTCISPFPANLTIDNACQRTFGRGRESPLPSGLQAMLQVSPPLLSLSEANFLWPSVFWSPWIIDHGFVFHFLKKESLF